MGKLVLGVLDAGLEERSGGAYNLLEGLLKTAGNFEILVKVIGTSVDLRKSNYSNNINIVSLNKSSGLLKKITKDIRALPYIGNSLGASKLGGIAEVLLASLGSGISFGDIQWWLYPHCFSPVPRLGRVAAICYDLQHYTYPEHFPWIIRRMRQEGEASLSNVEKVICISNFTRDMLLNRYPQFENKTVAIYPPVNIEANPLEIENERNRIKKSFQKPFSIYPAVDWPHKNHILLLDAAKILRKDIGPEFQIILTGQRRRGTWLRDQIKNYGVSDVVVDLGQVSPAVLIAFYREARALLFPSLYEGFGIPLVEAMLFGVPIIASNCTAIPEITRNAAVLCNPTMSEDFSEAIKKMLFDNEIHAVLSKAAYERSKIFGGANWWKTFLSNIDY